MNIYVCIYRDTDISCSSSSLLWSEIYIWDVLIVFMFGGNGPHSSLAPSLLCSEASGAAAPCCDWDGNTGQLKEPRNYQPVQLV